jgi:hypothetical protein
MVSVTFLHLKDTKPSGNLEYCFSGRLAFSLGQIPTHAGKVWSETFASVPWSVLTRPDTNSHRQGLIAGSDKFKNYYEKTSLGKLEIEE